ncbi:MAG: nucleotide exchange factor GrpE [Candidatus Colwellbacteria bacterium]|nr:nucleotide exchange factor GrpE [Candidatus Colwellbacteria bacterium]
MNEEKKQNESTDGSGASSDNTADTGDTEMVLEEENGISEVHEKLKKLKEKLEVCEKEKREYLEGWQRAKADFINFRNDEAKRFEDMARFVTVELIREFLPVLDSFDLSLGHSLPQNVERGILLIRSQFEEVLKRRGLQQIEVEGGEQFNPEKHESIGEIESKNPSGTIAEVMQRGYIFRDKVLRPVRVRIAK